MNYENPLQRIPQKGDPIDADSRMGADELASSIWETLGCTETLSLPFIRQVLDDITLFDLKQHDRGPGNIQRFGEKGIIIRMADKYEKIYTSGWEERTLVGSEPVEQEYADMAVYSVIARLVRKGEWK